MVCFFFRRDRFLGTREVSFSAFCLVLILSVEQIFSFSLHLDRQRWEGKVATARRQLPDRVFLLRGPP